MVSVLILPLIKDSCHEPSTKPSSYGFYIQHFNSICLTKSFIPPNLIKQCDNDVKNKKL